MARLIAIRLRSGDDHGEHDDGPVEETSELLTHLRAPEADQAVKRTQNRHRMIRSEAAARHSADRMAQWHIGA